MGATTGSGTPGAGPPTNLPLDPAVVADAVAALELDAGCRHDRAQGLVQAVARAAADEALALAAGSATVHGSVVDARVARLQRVISVLPNAEPVPTDYEVGALFRITTSQARTVLRTYEARYAAAHRARMGRALRALRGRKITDARGVNQWEFVFTDPNLLEHAVDELRRCGLARGVVPDRQTLILTVRRDQTDRHGRDAADVLAGKPVP